MARQSAKRVTKTIVDALQPGEAAWDTEIKGFGCRRQASGRFYILKYRTINGRQRWHTIGMHGASWTPDSARREALRLKADVSRGGDPSGDKQQKRLENTIAELADRYLTEHALPHNKPSTVAEAKRIVEKRIKPELGMLKISELSRSDIKRWHQSMSDTPVEANRALAYCSKMLSLAATEWEFRSDNPCIGIKRFPEKVRERFYSDEEMRKFGNVLSECEKAKSELPGVILLVRLLAATGMRLGEGLTVRWEDVDLPGRAIRLRDAKAGARTVHLGAEAVVLLDSVKKEKGFIVTGTDPGKPLTAGAMESAWRRIRAKAGIPDGRMHDLRHTFGTYAALGGANAFAVRDLLGHKTLAMTGRYVERAADMVRSTADIVSKRVSIAMTVRSEKEAVIIELPQRKAQR